MSGEAGSALVTGASAGIGQACADALHDAVWTVTGASRRGTSAGGWTGLVMDVDDDTSVRCPAILDPSGSQTRRQTRSGSSGLMISTEPGPPQIGG